MSLIELFRNLPPSFQALLASGFTWGMTALGAATVFVAREAKQKVLNAMLGFAAGRAFTFSPEGLYGILPSLPRPRLLRQQAVVNEPVQRHVYPGLCCQPDHRPILRFQL